MAQKSGKLGYVEIGAVNYNFEEWDITISGDLPDMSHFRCGGGRKLVPGIVVSDVSLKGPHDVGAMALTATTEYVIHLGLDAGLELLVTARCSDINVNNKYKDGPRVKADFKSSDGTVSISGIS